MRTPSQRVSLLPFSTTLIAMRSTTLRVSAIQHRRNRIHRCHAPINTAEVVMARSHNEKMQRTGGGSMLIHRDMQLAHALAQVSFRCIRRCMWWTQPRQRLCESLLIPVLCPRTESSSSFLPQMDGGFEPTGRRTLLSMRTTFSPQQ